MFSPKLSKTKGTMMHKYAEMHTKVTHRIVFLLSWMGLKGRPSVKEINMILEMEFACNPNIIDPSFSFSEDQK